MAKAPSRGSRSAVPCPHCGKPLKVLWEVYRVWPVERTDDGSLILGGDPPEFEAGTCEECGGWVDPDEHVGGDPTS